MTQSDFMMSTKYIFVLLSRCERPLSRRKYILMFKAEVGVTTTQLTHLKVLTFHFAAPYYV